MQPEPSPQEAEPIDYSDHTLEFDTRFLIAEHFKLKDQDTGQAQSQPGTLSEEETERLLRGEK